MESKMANIPDHMAELKVQKAAIKADLEKRYDQDLDTHKQQLSHNIK